MWFCEPPVSCSTAVTGPCAGKVGLRVDPRLQRGPAQQAVEVGKHGGRSLLGLRAMIDACPTHHRRDRPRRRPAARRHRRPARGAHDRPARSAATPTSRCRPQRCGRCCSPRRARRAARTASPSGSSCSPTGRSRSGAKLLIGDGARRAWAAQARARRLRRRLGHASTTRPRRASARTMQALRRRVRPRARARPAVPRALPRADAVRGRVGVPRVSRTSCWRRVPSGSAACLTALALPRGGRAAHAAAASPRTCSWPRRSRSAGPRARRVRSVAARSASWCSRSVGAIARVGGRPARYPVHRGRPAPFAVRTFAVRSLAVRILGVRRRRAVMTWDFSTEPEFQEKLDWIDGVRARPRSSRSTSRSRRTLVYDQSHPVHREVDPPAAGEGEGAGPVGLPPRSRPRRPRRTAR